MDSRSVITRSWQRCRMSGLRPTLPDLRIDPDAVDSGSRLASAARPVLAELSAKLADEPFCVFLADREARILGVPAGGRGLRGRMAENGAVAGALYVEETTGTNSIATVHELRRPLAVHGPEHYLEAFKPYTCYGQPITHPVTRRLEGVLDITCLTEHASPLLAPFLARAVQDIEERLLHTTRRAQLRMLAEFQTATAGSDRPVLVLGEDLLLASPATAELLGSADQLRLRELAAELIEHGGGGSPSERRLPFVELSSGRSFALSLRQIGPGREGVVFVFEPPATVGPVRTRARARPESEQPSDAMVYIGGAPGSGRSTAARALARDAGGRERAVVILEAAEAVALGEAAWLTSLEAATTAAPALLIIEDVHLLPAPCAVRLQRLMERAQPRIALTGPASAELTGYAAALAASCSVRIALPPLRDRAGELPRLIAAMLRDLGAGSRVRFLPSTLQVLAAQPWPGNLRELRAVVRAVLARHSAGDIRPRDLPEEYRSSPRLRRMTPLQRAEHDAITAALREHGGNKLRAARHLGISRTTLYSRMRVMRLDG